MKANLRGHVVKVNKLKPGEQARMFSLMTETYENVTQEQFQSDLSKKNKVILLRDQNNLIQGFSTLYYRVGRCSGRPYLGVFSGDTVVTKEFWGQKVLGKVFLKELFLMKLRHPFKPLYWFLISKGYKTYLMLANNFKEYYPRPDWAIPDEKKKIIDDFYSQLYPKYFDAQKGVIRFPVDTAHLKQGVAEITPELLQSNPKIAFFEKVNAGWRRGDELACLGRMTLLMPLAYQIKVALIPIWRFNLRLWMRLRRRVWPLAKTSEV